MKRYFLLISLLSYFNFNAQTRSLEQFLNPNDQLKKELDSLFNSLTDTERVAQIFMPVIGQDTNTFDEALQLVKDKSVGGFLLLKDEREDHKINIDSLNNLSCITGGIPLLFSIDAEPSLINYRILGSKKSPQSRDITSISESKQIAQQISRELNDLGIHINFAPVVDISSRSSAIKGRSFGSDGRKVVELANAFMEESFRFGIVTSAKHFPGHGLVTGDSHNEPVSIKGRLHEVPTYKHLNPKFFITVMIGHINVEANRTYSTDNIPASCSPLIIKDLLRGELGFNGLIFSDALSMDALSEIENPPLAASKAGCDILLRPENTRQSHKDILEAIKQDATYREQVYDSVKRILRLKLCLGLFD